MSRHAYCVWETDGTIYGYDRNAGGFPIPVYTHVPAHTNYPDYRSRCSRQLRHRTRFRGGFNLIGKHRESLIANSEGQQIVKFSRLRCRGIARFSRMLF